MAPPKTKVKKRKRPPLQLDGLVNLGGDVDAVGGVGGTSLEDCLGEMEQCQQQQPTTTTTVETDAPRLKDSTSTSSNSEKVPASPSSSSPKPQLSLIGTPLSWNKNKSKAWKANLFMWQAHGRYTPGLLPSFDLELSRHFQVQALSQYVLEACPSLRMPALERWLLDCKVEEASGLRNGNNTSSDSHKTKKSKRQRREHRRKQRGSDSFSDPVLPSNPSLLPATRRLEQEMEHCWQTDNGNDKQQVTDNVKKVVKELCRRTSAAVQELTQKQRQLAGHSPFQKGDWIVVDSSTTIVSLFYHRKRWKQPFRIKLNQSHYDKLARAFETTHGLSLQSNKPQPVSPRNMHHATPHIFHLLVMTLTLRYSSLAGGQLLNDLRGGGMQGAVHEDVFQVLDETTYAIPQDAPKQQQQLLLLEGFASPLNCACSNYASAFAHELEFHFGSLGTFQDLVGSTLEKVLVPQQQQQPLPNEPHVVCELNPPFAPAVMDQMVETVSQWLKVAESRQCCLSLVAVVPTATNHGAAPIQRFAQASFQRMVLSPYCRQEICLQARHHGYVEGAQHLRPTRYKESQYDTTVLLLQTTRAHECFPQNPEEWEDKIRQAFQDKHKLEVAAARRANQKEE